MDYKKLRNFPQTFLNVLPSGRNVYARSDYTMAALLYEPSWVTIQHFALSRWWQIFQMLAKLGKISKLTLEYGTVDI